MYTVEPRLASCTNLGRPDSSIHNAPSFEIMIINVAFASLNAILPVESHLTKHGIVDEVMAPILQHEFRKEMLEFACSEDDASGLTMDVHRSLPFPSRLGDGGISNAMKRSVLIYLVRLHAHCILYCCLALELR